MGGKGTLAAGDISLDQLAQLAPDNGWLGLGPHRRELAAGVVRGSQTAKQAGQNLAFDQQASADADGGQEAHQHLGGAGLNLEEPFEIGAGVVRAHRFADSARQGREAGKPRNRTRHEPVPFPAVGDFPNKNSRLERFSSLGYYCASAQ
jgi:hypothetical protein